MIPSKNLPENLTHQYAKLLRITTNRLKSSYQGHLHPEELS